MARIISLCAGTVLPVGCERTIDIAAATGYTHVGLRVDPAATGPQDWLALRRRADDAGVTVFDTEVVRLGITPRRHIELLIDATAVLGARWLLTVSHHEDPAVTTAELNWMSSLCASVAPDVRPALEFMAFTAVRTIDDALPIALRTGAGLVIDALHVFRTGTAPQHLAQLMSQPGAPDAYLQLCDTTVAHLAPEELADEARHQRYVPGTGLLPLSALIQALPPETPIATEVQSDSLLERMGPEELARACRMAVKGLSV